MKIVYFDSSTTSCTPNKENDLYVNYKYYTRDN